jgi:hypothetical protein
MEGEDEAFWLIEAELLASLSTKRPPMNVLGIATPDIAKKNGGAP